ncbi:protein kinase PINOID 2-like [Tripterygium wilfordii]|uniref:protein kinase PINOID 2-like n=1 Tax=Tripterygium wilfordii TaxID=458696 RepID=UPI0018F80F01|nr:protein kinase PINOID 2-like [Tripterygium wilfordii]
MASIARDESDYDSSSSSSITVPDSSRSWMSNTSFGSRRSSVSVASSSAETTPKPHKANQAAWEAMKRLRLTRGHVGLDHFRLIRRLGSGDIGNVYLCQIRNPMVGLPQCFYAMKVVDREALAVRKKLQRAEMEKEILGMLDHPFLPTLYAEFDASHYSCLVMEYCPGGDLYAARQRRPSKLFSIASARFYAAETLLALEYLHMMGIVYRDLKPENVLVREDGHIMLTDFDLSFKCDVVPKLLRSRTKMDEAIISDIKHAMIKCSTPSCARYSTTPMKPVLSCFSARKKRTTTITTTTITEKIDHDNNHDDGDYHHEVNYDIELVAEPINAKSKSFVGTHEYLAPEVISGQGHGSAVDWWTFGVFLYEMLYGRTPFKGENNEKTLINILKKPLTFPRMSSASFSSSKEVEEMVKVQDLISKLLVKNPKKRIGSLKGSAEIKRHEFFKGVNWALIRSVKPPEVPKNGCFYKINRANYFPKLSKKERDEPYQVPHYFDYF